MRVIRGNVGNILNFAPLIGLWVKDTPMINQLTDKLC